MTSSHAATDAEPVAESPAAPPRRWQLFLTPHASGAFNMAMDEALMGRAVTSGCWIFRVYGWNHPTVSFGRNQSAAGIYDPDRLAQHGYDSVRRPTGGRAILHHHEVTYSVTAPTGSAGSLDESYVDINRLLVGILKRLGVDASIASGTQRAPLPGPIPCFDHPSAGELTAGGRKLAGSAQWRSHEALLQHGSILLDDEQHLLNDLLTDPMLAAPAPPAATLRQLLGYLPSLQAMHDAAAGVLEEDSGAPVTPFVPDASLDEAMRTLLVRYQDHDWTWRR
jgi:lipoyl(octanoyl) transferase